MSVRDLALGFITGAALLAIFSYTGSEDMKAEMVTAAPVLEEHVERYAALEDIFRLGRECK
jgi:hypothetical protein